MGDFDTEVIGAKLNGHNIIGTGGVEGFECTNPKCELQEKGIAAIRDAAFSAPCPAEVVKE